MLTFPDQSTLKKLRSKVSHSTKEAIDILHQLQKESNMSFMEQVALLLAKTFSNGNKVLIAGNGGSLCDAAHFAEELTGVFRTKRKALPALVLSESSHMSCVGNDLGFDEIFARGIEAFGNRDDVFIALSTSGNSKNLIRACQVASEKGMEIILFLGRTGGKMKGMGRYEMIIEGPKFSDRIQEAHMAALHIIIELIETLLFPNNL